MPETNNTMLNKKVKVNVVKAKIFKDEVRFSVRQMVFIGLIIAALGTYLLLSSFAAVTTVANFEAELASPPAGASVVTDSAASAGKALLMTARGAASGTVNLPSTANQMTVRLKGESCGGSPQLIVRIDGAQVQSSSVTATTWTESSPVNVNMASGAHTVAVEMASDAYTQTAGNSGKIKCQRKLYVDKVTFFGSTPDTTTVAVNNPVNGSTVSGNVAVEAKASGTNGISKVEFYLDGSLAKTEQASPYCMAGDSGALPCYGWNSATVANGSHTITAYAYDSAGTKSAGSTVTFTVNNTVTGTDPSGGGANPSGETIPVGDITTNGGTWRQIFTDDFNTPVALGSFPSSSWSSSDPRRTTYPGTKWSAYPSGWRDTKGQTSSDPTIGGWYNPEKTISINNGMMDLWMHTELLDGVKKRLVSAPMPRINGPGTGDFDAQSYGRYAVRFRVDPTRLVNNFTGYKVAWLLWPKDNNWPTNGEIDFPEGDLDDTIYGFMHWQGGTSGSSQYYASSGKRFTDWHTAVIEWGPGRNAFYLDGALMTNASGGKSEWFDKVPNTPMRYVLQSETELGSTIPAENTEGHIQVDWVAVWAKQ